jgi:hypothetical protein
MKKILTAVCLIFISGIAVAQWQQNGNLLPYKNYESPITLAKDMISGNITLPEPHTNANLSELKTLAWNWDTLICYNASNMLYERYTQTFDASGYILTRSIEKRERFTWVNNLKTTYTYSAEGKMLTELEQVWQNGAWENSQRYTYSYKSDGKMFTVLLEKWQLNAWVNNSQSIYTYDTNGRLVTVLVESWNSSIWMYYRKTSYTYDPDGNMLKWTSQLWRDRTWMNEWRYIFSYDVNGNKLTTLHQNGFETYWMNNWSDTLKYNTLGKVSNEVYVNWQLNTWVYNTRWTNSYDVKGRLILCISELWNVSKWVNNDKHIYTYASYLRSDLHQLYRDGIWVNDWKYYYNYDFRGTLISFICQAWQIKHWVNDWRYSYTYDKQCNSSSGEYEIWDQNSGWMPGIPDNGLGVFSKTVQIYTLYNIYRYEASSKSITTGITDIEENNSSLMLYPNPATDNITIETKVNDTKQKELISVCDILGNIILQQPVLQIKTNINISDLRTGVYLIKVETNNGVMIKKLVKE